ncbi:hypothetical protein [Methylobacterium nodulans]|uniref:Phage tail protein n=1 Tax=Methylobacterium nodulans (strain LMG 21967 / CNCM I-2342 / ORS 2060) TaxID=460265 RepID=B8ITA6_METNO|nr:hypothetical protein [Methylobacterium nodulans]ACL56992.1 hypothetical protein Mnod_2005 [Methylobacterium nodulans ORS 2060]
MTTPNLLPGNRFRAYRGDGTAQQNWAFICLATSITLTLTNAFEDATVPDCDDPLAIPVRKSIMSSTAWGGRIAGQVDATRLAKLRADAGSQTPIPYRFLVDQTAANGGGAWIGNVFVENLEITKNNNGIVSFTCQFRGDGPLTWTDATA